MTGFFRRTFSHSLLALAALSVALPLAFVSCGGGGQAPPPEATSPTTSADGTGQELTDEQDRSLTVYSGRSESLVHPLLEAFGERTGVSIKVKYAASAASAATILEEGDNNAC